MRSRFCGSGFAVVGFLIVGIGVSNFAPRPASAGIITSTNVVPVPVGTVGSGNGTLDFLLLTESSGGSTNSSGSFNGDNSNTDLPTGNGHTTASGSFITSFGEIRSFYRLNFPDGSGGSTVDQILVMVDVNETGG